MSYLGNSPVPDESVFEVLLGTKADVVHEHVIADVTGLQNALDAKASTSYVSDRLAEFGGNTTAKLITDWNSVVGSGWYMANEFAANAPIANWCIGTVIVHNSEWQVQEVIAFSSNDESGDTGTWHREKNMNVWSAWHRVYKTGGEIATVISDLSTYVTTGTTQTVTGAKTFTEDLSVVKSSGEAQVIAVWTGANPSSCYVYNTSGSSGLYDSVEGPIVYSNKATNDTVLRSGAGGTIQFHVGPTNYGNVSALGNLTMTGDAYFNGVRVGKGAGIGNIHNTAIGDVALISNTDGYFNTAIGNGALYANAEGMGNTAIGTEALVSNVTGSLNTAVGVEALRSNAMGASYNTAVGAYSLTSNTTGDNNAAVGRQALLSNTIGYSNTAIGVLAAYSNTTGTHNTAVGTQALYSNTTGSYNTACGMALGLNTTYSRSSGFGYGAEVTSSDQVQLGNSFSTTYVYGTVQNRSDLRDKSDVRDTVLGLDFIEALRPVDYRWDMRDYYRTEMSPKPEIPVGATPEQIKEIEDSYKVSLAEHLEANKPANLVRDGSKKRSRYHHGLIAQEVKALLDEKGIDFGGYQDHKVSGGEDVLSIGYDELIAPLIKAVQELSAVNKQLEARIKILEVKN